MSGVGSSSTHAHVCHVCVLPILYPDAALSCVALAARLLLEPMPMKASVEWSDVAKSKRKPFVFMVSFVSFC
jgi:hypothetical protein